MLAIELSTSIDCAREILGTASRARAVMPLVASDSISSGRKDGVIRLTTIALSLNFAISSVVGAATFKTTWLERASSLDPIVAPA
ncbi:unannotated protein [freshwater metagenome]|uniref:Unannotated protein n=1 Tax=freshwater metagenome TaxID=449393 RepID=A0A6J6NNZ8_9ZZZZ